MRLMQQYSNTQQVMARLSLEMEGKLETAKAKTKAQEDSATPVIGATASRKEQFDGIRQKAVTTMETALRKIDAEEEKAASQLKIKYLAMRLPSQSEDETND